MNRIEDYIGNKQLYVDINDELEKIALIAHVLSSKLRLEIIHMVGRQSMSIKELA